jgi:hypothetical protein
MEAPPAPRAGWYPDPATPGAQRFWDGGTWTEHSVPDGLVPSGPAVITVTPSTNRLAIASLVLALLLGSGITSVGAVILGHWARRQIDQSGGAEWGRGIAMAGIVIGWFGILVFVALVGLARGVG